MREIKFRYFDTKRQEFITDYDVYFIDSNCILAGDLDNPPVVDITKNVVVSQYTGLKDSKGNEIYEGDILKGPEYYEHQENQTMTYFNWEVTYENCAFRLDGISMEEDYEWISAECEVIGNKFENPELLQ
ncbi:YopX family protein, partial [Bacillus toyonensis]|uniref:YopX family protein n=1 Tax=Bacillus toyonensis TaxID=155322 RepID=UPI000C03033C